MASRLEHVFVSVGCDGLCFVCVLVRRGAITGTLDPVRNLTGLTRLVLNQNNIGGTFVRTAFGIAALGAVLACGWQLCGVSRQCGREISRGDGRGVDVGSVFGSTAACCVQDDMCLIAFRVPVRCLFRVL